MQDTPQLKSSQQLHELQAQLQDALDALVKLADDRRARHFELWNDPELVQESIESIRKQVVLELPDGPEFLRLFVEAGRQFGSLVAAFTDQFDVVMAVSSVQDSVDSYLHVMYRMELLFITYADIGEYTVAAIRDLGGQIESIEDARQVSAETFRAIIEQMRTYHDRLFDHAYIRKK